MKRFGVIFILFLMVAGLSFAPSAYAVQPTNDYSTFANTVDQKSTADQISAEWYATNFQGNLMGGLLLYAIGSPNPQSTFYYKKSALAYMGNVITGMYDNPPANLALWVNDTAQSLGFIPKQAYAQGIGFTGLTPLLDIWKAFRNIAYAVLAVIMVVIGFMIMFRQKIDPKTVITVQNALPRIVVTLLLITFSYAIVGLMIDLMYVALLFIMSVLVSASHGALGSDTVTKYLTGNFFTMLGAVFGGTIQSIDDIIAFFGPLPMVGAAGATSATGGLLGFLLGGGIAAGASAAAVPIAIGLAVPILAVLLVVIVLFFGVIRLLFMLIGAYIQIIIALVASPFLLLAGAFPGNNAFGSWIVGLISNLLVFPITAGLLLIANILANLEQHPLSGAVTGTGPVLWTPPLIGNSGHGVAGVIALGILLTIPSIVKSAKEAFKAKPIVSLGGVGQAMTSPFGTATQLLSLSYYAQNLTHKDVTKRAGLQENNSGEQPR